MDHDTAPRVTVFYGTRPEAVKLAPVVRALHDHPGLRCRVVVSGQHREMLDEVNQVFGITPDDDLSIFRPGQSLDEVLAGALTGFGRVLDEHPAQAVVVQGDTTSGLAGALAAFHRSVPVLHLEAGLRTGDLASPFPEEANRKLIGALARVHCAATPRAAANLRAEGVPDSRVLVTGNTVVDALHWASALRRPVGDDVVDHAIAAGRRIVLVTAHRRESWSGGIGDIASAVVRLALRHPRVLFVVPMHRNPVVRAAFESVGVDLPNVHLREPVTYAAFANLLAHATVVVTDSGGIQEEAPSLDVPVVIVRDTTERPELVESGGGVLVGTDADLVAATVTQLLTDETRHAQMAGAVNPFGDGHAAARVVAALDSLLLGDGSLDGAAAGWAGQGQLAGAGAPR